MHNRKESQQKEPQRLSCKTGESPNQKEYQQKVSQRNEPLVRDEKQVIILTFRVEKQERVSAGQSSNKSYKLAPFDQCANQ